ncbi:MAG: hypothetical protein IJF76_05740 [Clostridia bacterium]|nr:hypothetical protein [Clostridia bacterium]
MVRLKNKPSSCDSCPFCYQTSGYVHNGVGIEERVSKYCGVRRDSADMESCPLK